MMDHKVVLLLVAVLCWAGRISSVSSNCEDTGGERLISQNRSLAPLSLVEASGQVSSGPKGYVYNFAYAGSGESTWCLFETNPERYIVLGFTSPVLITALLSSGRSSALYVYYVTNFTLEYALTPGDSANFTYYLDESNSPKYFEVPEMNTLFRFERPLQAQQLRLTAVDWIDSSTLSPEYVCQGVALYGCPFSQDSTSTTDDAVETMAPTSSISTSSTTSEAITDEDQTALAQFVVVKDYQALGIALPIALITIIVCAALVAVGVYLCVYISRRSTEGEKRRYENLDLSSKTLERSASEIEHGYANTDRKKSLTKILNNPIYGSSSPELHTEEHIYTSASETGYEPIGQVVESKAGEANDDDLIDNLAYGDVEVHPLEHEAEGAAVLDIKQNECYESSAPTTPLPGEGEYAYATTQS